MTLKDAQKLKPSEIISEINMGGRFVIYTYTISLLIITFKKPSEVYFLTHNDSGIKHGWLYFLISLILGWWGFPWGPIYTIQSLWYAFFPIVIDHNEIMDINTNDEEEFDYEKLSLFL